MKNIKTKKELNCIIEQEQFCLIYLSRPSCGVCIDVKPKVENICKKYPMLKTFYIDLDINEEISGQLSIFTIPAILVFVDGKEFFREARFFSIDDIDKKISRIIELSK